MRKNYQKYLVSIDLESRRALIEQLSEVMRSDPGGGSHERGEPAGGRRPPWPTTVWKIQATRSPKVLLDKMIGQIATETAARRIRAAKRRYPDLSIILNIGILYHGAYASLLLEPERLAWCSRSGVKIHVAAYPCSD